MVSANGTFIHCLRATLGTSLYCLQCGSRRILQMPLQAPRSSRLYGWIDRSSRSSSSSSSSSSHRHRHQDVVVHAVHAAMQAARQRAPFLRPASGSKAACPLSPHCPTVSSTWPLRWRRRWQCTTYTPSCIRRRRRLHSRRSRPMAPTGALGRIRAVKHPAPARRAASAMLRP